MLGLVWVQTISQDIGRQNDKIKVVFALLNTKNTKVKTFKKNATFPFMSMVKLFKKYF